MSKSLNNFFTVKDILKTYPAETLRYFLVATHYRSPLDFSDGRLKEAQASLTRLKNAQDNLNELLQMATENNESAKDVLEFAVIAKAGFYDAMNDDFNTALALAHMFDLTKKINIYHQSVLNGEVSADKEDITKILDIYNEMVDILGILQGNEDNVHDDKLVDDLMNIIISIRQDARKNKDWTTADKIRDALNEIGVVIEDSPNGPRWKK